MHERAFVFDGHVHVIDRQLYLGGDIGERVPDGQFDLPRAREGGVDALFFSVFVTEDYYPPRFETRQAFRLVDLALRQLEGNRDRIQLALNAADIARIHRQGKMAAVLDLEGGFDLDGDLGVLRDLYRLGLRAAQLPAHNWANNFADSCCALPKYHGLNARGREVVREMNRLGDGDQRLPRLRRDHRADAGGEHAAHRGHPTTGCGASTTFPATCRTTWRGNWRPRAG